MASSMPIPWRRSVWRNRCARRCRPIPIAAIKIGMLATAATICAFAQVLADHPGIPVVLDPVLVSTSGRALLDPDATEALPGLFSACTLVTPNLPELSVLAAMPGGTSNQARYLLAAGAKAVLVKGGHADGRQAIDILFRAGHEEQPFASPRLAAAMRGTGCMLARRDLSTPCPWRRASSRNRDREGRLCTASSVKREQPSHCQFAIIAGNR